MNKSADQHTVLVLNCGSSSIKFAVINPVSGQSFLSGLAENLISNDPKISWNIDNKKNDMSLEVASHESAMQAILEILNNEDFIDQGIDGVGHRVVHGGESFKKSSLIDNEVLSAISGCNHLAPLHNPVNYLGIELSQRLLPGIPQVAVFDTAFHQSMPEYAYCYPLPLNLYEEHGVRKYGFHGTSVRYVSNKAAELLKKPLTELNLICAHLGNGCSVTSISKGNSVDTSMGLTPLEGLMMGTRCGDIDPSIHSYLSHELGLSLEDITDILNKKSGLLGISGISSDMRKLEEAEEEGDERAALAISMFCYKLSKTIAALSVSLPSIDALIFTGGIGENAINIRKKVLKHLSILNFHVDEVANGDHGAHTESRISDPTGHLAVVIPTNEELMIAKDTYDLVCKGY